MSEHRSPAFAKPHRGIGVAVSPPAPHPRFEQLPALPAGALAMDAATYLPNLDRDAQKAGRLVFHAFGDSGGVYGTQAQDAVAGALGAQLSAGPSGAEPQFAYHLGDVVYFNGEDKLYPTQFYEPYQYYNAPIFAIPGNHDGDTHVRRGDPPDNDPWSLYGFMRNFCNRTGAVTFKHRPPMNQPYCYWELEAPFVRIVGLYSNVDGTLDDRSNSTQRAWLQQQLEAVPQNKWLIVAVHHPCYSLDTVHGGYGEILKSLDSAFSGARRFPDLVLSGHVHDYQRFSRKHGAASIPYIICGNAGYANDERLLHKVQSEVANGQLPFKTVDQTGVALEAFDDQNAGFLRITATSTKLTVDYFAVPFNGNADTTNPADTLTVHAANSKTVR